MSQGGHRQSLSTRVTRRPGDRALSVRVPERPGTALELDQRLIERAF